MKLSVYHFKMPTESTCPMMEFCNYGILCAFGDFPVKSLIRYGLEKTKWVDEVVAGSELEVTLIQDLDDQNLKDFFLHNPNDLSADFGISQNQRFFHDSTIMKLMFKNTHDSIRKAVQGELEFDQFAYALFLIKLYGINPRAKEEKPEE